MKRNNAVLILALLVLTVSCSDSELQKIAKGLLATGKAVQVAQSTVIEANRQGLVSDADTAEVLLVCLKINRAGQDVSLLIRNLEALGAGDRETILQVLRPCVSLLQSTLDSGLTGIKNPQTLQEVRGLLLTIQATLNTIQIVVAAGG